MFVLLKIILWFIRPLIWAIILFAWGLLSRRPVRKKRLIWSAFAVLLFFSNPAIIRGFLSAYEPAPVAMDKLGSYQAGIVLGGFVAYNKQDDRGYFNPASDRFIQTALLYKTGHIRKVIVPAGNGYIVGHNFQEAEYVRQRLVELGVPTTDIYTDTESRNTLENAQNTKRILDTAHLGGPFLLISSAMHLPRARKVFDKQGIPVQLFPCDFTSRFRSNNFIEDYLLPTPIALQSWDAWLKELLGMVTYRVTGKG
ncbi:MAG: YdcF family protein [Chitinophagaceae bacterium]|nr:MAG: YdcF family protein [Chitinophagaceae bacterium]